VKDELS